MKVFLLVDKIPSEFFRSFSNIDKLALIMNCYLLDLWGGTDASLNTVHDLIDDMSICICGCCCTSCLFGQNVGKIDGSNCCLWCCAYVYLICWILHYLKR